MPKASQALTPREELVLQQLQQHYPKSLYMCDLVAFLHISQGAIWSPCQRLLRKGCITAQKALHWGDSKKPPLVYTYSPAGVTLMNARLASLIAQLDVLAAPEVGVRRVVSPMQDSDVYKAEKRAPKPYTPRPGTHAAGLVELLRGRPEGALMQEIVAALGTPETNLYNSIGRLLKGGYIRREKVMADYKLITLYRYFIGDKA